MSNNYTDYNRRSNQYRNQNYNKPNLKPNEPVKAETVEEIVEAVAEEAVEAIEAVIEEPVAPPAEPKEGRVVNCNKLNVRKAPNSNAGIVCEIARNEKVLVNLEESTNEYYKVYLAAGVEGFCMRKYIVV